MPIAQSKAITNIQLAHCYYESAGFGKRFLDEDYALEDATDKRAMSFDGSRGKVLLRQVRSIGMRTMHETPTHESFYDTTSDRTF